MPTYDKPSKVLMREWAEQNLRPGQEFSKSEPIEWFSAHYPRLRSNTVAMHVEIMSINTGATRQHHPSVHKDSGHDLFFKLGSNCFRLYDIENDPAPIYDAVNPDTSQLNPNPDEDAGNNIDIETLEAARQFAYERDLQNFLVKNLELIEPGLNLYRDPDEEDIVGVEFDAGGRRIDILAKDSSDRFVVIELKVSRGHDRVFGQLARYMAWIKKNMSPESPVRGIIVANTISDDLRLAASLIPEVSLVEYRMQFEILKVA